MGLRCERTAEVGGGAEVPVCGFKRENVRLVLFCSSKEHPTDGDEGGEKVVSPTTAWSHSSDL